MEELNNQLEQLQKMVEIPQLFLSDYFISLRNEMDKFYLKKKIEGKEEDDIWMKIIARIDTFEKELTRSNRKSLTDSIIQETNKQIELIRSEIESFTKKLNDEANFSKQEEEHDLSISILNEDETDRDEEEYNYSYSPIDQIEAKKQTEVSRIKELITIEETKIKKVIFLNKTITCFNQNKLVIIENQFLTDQDLKKIKEK